MKKTQKIKTVIVCGILLTITAWAFSVVFKEIVAVNTERHSLNIN